MIPIAASVFASAFLLFQVQPLIVKYILPWFGGGPAVWSASMVFFQVLLVGGYAYAHVSRTRLPPRGQGGLHLFLLTAAMLTLPIVPSEAFKPDSAEAPTTRILLLLSVTIGLPYFVLASTAPLLQAWAVATRRMLVPYRLYALSNVGSLLALLSYPVVFEPWFGRQTQAVMWSAGFMVFSAASAWVISMVWRTNPPVDPPFVLADTARFRPATRVNQSLWVMLPAVASILLLAVTNEMTQDVAVIPFLWVLPLSLYLLSFIVAFDGDRWYVRSIFLTALVPATGGMIWMMFRAGTAPILLQVSLFSIGLFVYCMVCHGELARLKPEPSQLTKYYLWVAVGGALGGIFVGLVAPWLFDAFLELHLALLTCAALVSIVLFTDRRSVFYRGRQRAGWLLVAVLYVGLSYMLTRHMTFTLDSAVTSTRNFYGVLTVIRQAEGTTDERLTLRNGRIDHGMQFTAPARRSLPLTYYGPESGIGTVMHILPREAGRRIGLVGLGVGTVAAYSHLGDTLRVYEINPKVTDLARQWFSYLDESPAEIQIVHGDARLSLEREPAQRFDVLVLDAFSSDAIPIHLLTAESFAIYEGHLNPGGVLVVHLSNRHLNLEQVVWQHATQLGLEAVKISNGSTVTGIWSSHWMLLTQNQELLQHRMLQERTVPLPERNPIRQWTDDYANLLAVLRTGM